MISTNINKFHKFWCLFEVGSNWCKVGPKWGLGQAGRPTPIMSSLETLWRVP